MLPVQIFHPYSENSLLLSRRKNRLGNGAFVEDSGDVQGVEIVRVPGSDLGSRDGDVAVAEGVLNGREGSGSDGSTQESEDGVHGSLTARHEGLLGVDFFAVVVVDGVGDLVVERGKRHDDDDVRERVIETRE